MLFACSLHLREYDAENPQKFLGLGTRHFIAHLDDLPAVSTGTSGPTKMLS